MYTIAATLIALSTVPTAAEGWYVQYHQALGPVQALAGSQDDTLWLFVEVEEWIGSGWIRSRVVGSDKFVVVVHPDKEPAIQRLPGDSPSFNKRISCLFRRGDQWYLVSREGNGDIRSVFELTKDGFKLLSLRESEAMLASLSGEGPQLWSKCVAACNTESAKEGFAPVVLETDDETKRTTIPWREGKCVLDVRPGDKDDRCVLGVDDGDRYMPIKTFECKKRWIGFLESESFFSRPRSRGHPYKRQ